MPGVPGVVLGHNEHMAWGVTALVVDQQDLFLEQVHPENPQLYLYDGAWEEATVIEEVITIKDEDEPHIERVEITRNGPIINKIVDDGPYQAISLNWTGYNAGQELMGILKINRSRNAIEFNEALDGFVTPALSWVFADHDGNIGYRGQSLIPIREKSNGLFPIPGWDPDYQWKGFIPDDELPQIINPERGYIVTANNKPVDDEYPYEIGRSFYPYRAGRLTEIVEQQIESKQPITVQQMQEMQVDFLNTEARALLPMLLEALAQSQKSSNFDSLEQEVFQLLEDWDFVEGHDSATALVWQQWYTHLNEALFNELLGFPFENALVMFRVLQDAYDHPSHQVFAELDEEHHLVLDKVARETFSQAIESTVQLQGKNPDKWEWGKYHSLTIKHPLGAVKPLNLLFDIGSWELGGSGATPGALGYNRKKEEFSHGAGWRFAGDLASMDSFYDIVILGQSGQYRSPYYGDQVDIWAQGELLPMIYHKENKDDVKTMIFKPKQ